MFYIAQLFGLVGLIITVISFQQNNKKKLLNYQIFSGLFLAVHYFILNAITGVFMNLIGIMRNIIFIKYGKKVPLKYSYIIIAGIVALSFVFYDGFLSLLPGAACLVYTFGASQNNLTITRFSGLISSSLFLIYNIKVLAIVAVISTIIELISVSLAIYRFDIKQKKKKK
ncbi:MAG: YgjV family protein [Firmicutes bacterium]|nr:YgjV family protein [Bacillota bacterium]